MIMVTFVEVKGRQWSNVVKYAQWLPNLVKRILDAGYDNDDLVTVNGHQRSNVVKYAPRLPNLIRRILMQV